MVAPRPLDDRGCIHASATSASRSTAHMPSVHTLDVLCGPASQPFSLACCLACLCSQPAPQVLREAPGQVPVHARMYDIEWERHVAASMHTGTHTVTDLTQTQAHTDTQTHRDTQRHTETHRDTQRHTHRHIHTHTHTHTHRHRHTDTGTDTQTHRHTHTLTLCPRE